MIRQVASSPALLRDWVVRDETKAASPQISHRKRSELRSLVSLVMIVVLLFAAACGSEAPQTSVVPPQTPAGAQLGWLVAAMADLPDVRGAGTRPFQPGLSGRGRPGRVNRWLGGGEGAKLVWAKADGPSTVESIVSAGGTRARLWLYRRQPEPDRRYGHRLGHR